ncbi:MAG: methyltransferase [Pseudomonadota bacterium]
MPDGEHEVATRERAPEPPAVETAVEPAVETAVETAAVSEHGALDGADTGPRRGRRDDAGRGAVPPAEPATASQPEAPGGLYAPPGRLPFITRLRAAWASWRNRIVADPVFQARATRFALTRPVAAADARRLFDLTAGFVYSQVLAAVVELDLISRLEKAPAGAAEIAAGTVLGEAAAARLLEAAEAIDLLERVGTDGAGRPLWMPSRLGAALKANPGAVAMIRHHDMLYRDVAAPVTLLATGRTGQGAEPEIGRFWAYARDPGAAGRLAQDFGPEAVADYSALMAASQAFIADQVLDRLPLPRMRRLIDIGGGEGAFVEAAARRTKTLDLALVDLPAVAERARARLGAAGLEGRVRISGGDFFRDAPPFAEEGGADWVSLIRVLYDHDDDFAVAILDRARQALAPGGRLVIAEPMARLPGARQVGAYFALYLHAMGSGRIRSPQELAALARKAGFRRVRRRRISQPLLTGLLIAEA